METVIKEVETKKEVVELIQIEVPDYSEEVGEVRRLQEARVKSEQLRKKTIDACSANIAKQIEAYLVALFAPLFDENGKTRMFVSGFGGWTGSECYLVELDGTNKYAITSTGVYDFHNGSCSSCQWIEYDHPLSDLNDYYLFKIAKNWQNVKVYAKNSIATAIRDFENNERETANKNLDDAEFIKNFQI